MTSEINSIAIYITVGLTLLGQFYLIVVWKTKVDYKVDFIWRQVMEPLMMKAVKDGLLRKESPLRANVQALAAHDDLLTKAMEFYEQGGKRLADWQLMDEIQKKFGAELAIVAEEGHVSVEGCAIALAFYLRPEMELFKQFDTHEWKFKSQANC
jgi:hypothetical protein